MRTIISTICTYLKKLGGGTIADGPYPYMYCTGASGKNPIKKKKKTKNRNRNIRSTRFLLGETGRGVCLCWYLFCGEKKKGGQNQRKKKFDLRVTNKYICSYLLYCYIYLYYYFRIFLYVTLTWWIWWIKWLYLSPKLL